MVHRLPYPPNKGDKVRSYNILKHLSRNNNVFLGTFIDDPADEKYVDVVRGFCKEVFVYKLNKRFSFLRGLIGFGLGNSLSLSYYNVSGITVWINSVLENNKIDAVFVFSSAMGQFVKQNLYTKTLVDFVDVDSQKWTDYSSSAYFPISYFYAREARLLLRYERFLATQVKHSFFVTEKEKSLFGELASECIPKISALDNGVDSEFFAIDKNLPSPFLNNSEDIIPIVFTGAMDYLPNVDAVIWFVENIFPELLSINNNYRFFIVGRNPSKSVLLLKSEFVFVTGTVKDVRAYLQYASVVVAPLRIARGVQNKILEAMSMAKAVVASATCVQAINANDGVDIISADSPEDFINKICFLVDNPNIAAKIGSSARSTILNNYSWAFHLEKMDKYLEMNLS